jgi:predicted transport protein
MALFLTKNKKTKQLKKQNFNNEKELQNFIENNLEELFGIRFLATEFSTGEQHGGRIDSLGIDEDNAPVIIEYKWGEKDNIINQGLFYLDWLADHEGDFKLLAQEKINKVDDIDFGSARVVLIAQTFNKYDQHAINRMSENIELWSYANYENDIFELKLVASTQSKKGSNNKKQISKINYGNYSVSQHLKNKDKHVQELFKALQEKIFAFEAGQKIEEKPRKMYISYKSGRSFAELVVQKNSIKIWISGNINDPKGMLRDVSEIGRHGIGDLEVVLKSFDELDYVIDLIKQSYLQSI